MGTEVEIVLVATDGREIRVPGPACLIGRGEDCHVRLDQESISRRHCMIEARATDAIVRDLNSRNGTLLNGKRVEGDAPLIDGDILRVGGFEFETMIERLSASGPKPKTKVGFKTNIGPSGKTSRIGTADTKPPPDQPPPDKPVFSKGDGNPPKR